MHNENPADFPVSWIREETLSDVRLDGVTLAEAVALGPAILRDAVCEYAAAVLDQDSRLLASDPDAHHVLDLRDMTEALALCGDREAYPKSYRPTQPRTIAVVNGPAYTLALIVANNRLRVVDIGSR